MKVKTRFAPSPTGYIHLGNLRSAIYPYLVARQAGGEFVLRIEDTDQKRFVPGSEQLIIETLAKLGLDWDGEITHQTARQELYLKYARQLIERGLAYADPYTPEQVEGFRETAKAKKQPFLFRDYRPEQPPQWELGLPLRFKITKPQRYAWHDAVYGDLSAGPEALDDFIIIKSDGLPTYNFAHIIDDFEMGVTHVIRGQEYISSMPKYLALYDALEIAWPTFAHLPHILNDTGNKKLGKRDGAKSAEEYFREGILPEALLNFLAMLGWNDGTEQEIFSLDELVSKFELGRVQRSGARFETRRLLWLNGQWIKKLTLDDLAERARPFWGPSGASADSADQLEVLEIVRDRLKTLTDLPALSEYFFKRPTPDWTMIDANKQLSRLTRAEQHELLQASVEALGGLPKNRWDSENLQRELNKLLEKFDQKPAVLFSLIRFALTWAPFSPSLPETMLLLGQEETLARLRLSS